MSSARIGPPGIVGTGDRLPDPPAPLTDPESRRKEVRGLWTSFKSMNAAGASARAQLEDGIEDAKRAGRDAVAAMAAFNAALKPDDVRQALRRSVDDAAHEVEEITTAAAGLAGLGGTGRMSEETHALLGQALKSSEMMRRLGMLAGRMRRLAMAKRRSRTKHAALNSATSPSATTSRAFSRTS